MKELNLIFHHFGLATRQPEKARLFLENCGYSCGEPIADPIQNIQLIYCISEVMPDIEIIFPLNPGGPVDNILESRNEQIYHLCYVVADIEITLSKIKKAGFRVIKISSPQPAILFNHQNVGFYYIPGFGIIELLEQNEVF